ncbi:MAG: substrate-binding domain-containing protein [Gammaproteobacteria bacterium]|jgi:tungstate transport system substrate-binding protein
MANIFETAALRTTLLFLATLFLFTNGIAAERENNKVVRLATTTSTVNSGLLDRILPAYTDETGYEVHVIAVGTGKALRMGRDGDVDIVLVHAPAAEKAFVSGGYGEQRYPVMYNDFVIVGPTDDPAGIRKKQSAAGALAAIAGSKSLFISRGDDSGTHKKEKGLWETAGISPTGDWYREAGQGMGKVLQMTNELLAYTLTDRGTWLAYRDKSELQIAFQGDEVLHNPYGIIEVSAKLYPNLNHAGAKSLIDWITGLDAQQMIASYRIHGEQLFTPSATRTATSGKAVLDAQ